MIIESKPLWTMAGSALVVAAAGGAVFVGPAIALTVAAAVCVALWSMLADKKRVATVLVGALVLLVTLVPANRLGDGDAVLKVAVPALVLSLAGILAFRFALRVTFVGAALVAHLAFFALATVVRPDLNQWALFALIAAMSLSGFVAGQVVARASIWGRIATLIVAVAVGQSLYAIAELLLRLEPLWRGAGTLADGTQGGGRSELLIGFTRSQGTFGSPLLLCFLLLLALVIVMRGEFPVRRDARATVAIVIVAGMVAAGGRSALLLALVIWLLGKDKPASRFVKVAATGLVGLVFVLPLAGPAISAFMGTGSFTHRIGAFESVGRLLAERDFIATAIGDGAGATVRLFSSGILQNDGLEAVDNQFILTFIETGVLGLIIVAAIFINALRSAPGTLRLVLLICVVEFFVFDALGWSTSAFLIWLLIGVADSPRIGMPPLAESDAGRSRRPSDQFLNPAMGRK